MILFGLVPTGHPDLRRLPLHQFWPADYHPLLKDATVRQDFSDDGEPYPFRRVEGEGIYEITVGPVHAGIIEPGHFRFSVEGETIINLESRMYFVHKGIEKLFESATLVARSQTGRANFRRFERGARHGFLSGRRIARRRDHSAARGVPAGRPARTRTALQSYRRRRRDLHGHGFCGRQRARAALARRSVAPERAFGRTSALAWFPGSGRGEREISARRRLPTCVVPLPASSPISIRSLRSRPATAWCSIACTAPGDLSQQTAREMQVVGVAARASGIDEDARRDHPFAAYAALPPRVVVHTRRRRVGALDGARRRSARGGALDRVGARDAAKRQISPCRLDALPEGEGAFGLVEGWRGPIWHWVVAGKNNTLRRVKIKDPSFANWPALNYAILKNIVPDFPLVNKSFNLSYAGNDL